MTDLSGLIRPRSDGQLKRPKRLADMARDVGLTLSGVARLEAGPPQVALPRVSTPSVPSAPRPLLPGEVPEYTPENVPELRPQKISDASGGSRVPDWAPRVLDIDPEKAITPDNSTSSKPWYSLGRWGGEVQEVLKESAAGAWQLGKIIPGTVVGAGKLIGDQAHNLVTDDWDNDPGSWGSEDWWEHYFQDIDRFATGAYQGGKNFGQWIRASARGGGLYGMSIPTDDAIEASHEATDRYQTAWNEGRFLSEALGDVGIAAAGAGAAASLTRMAGAGVARAGYLPGVDAATAVRVGGRLGEAGSRLERFSYRADWSDPMVATYRGSVRAIDKAVSNIPNAKVANILSRVVPRVRNPRTGLLEDLNPNSALDRQRMAREIARSSTELDRQHTLAANQVRQVEKIIDSVNGDQLLQPAQRRLVTLVTSDAYRAVFREMFRTYRNFGDEAVAPLLRAWNERLASSPDWMKLTLDDIKYGADYYNNRARGLDKFELWSPEEAKAFQVLTSTLEEWSGIKQDLMLNTDRLTPEQVERPYLDRELKMEPDGSLTVVGETVENDQMPSRVAEIEQKLDTDIADLDTEVGQLADRLARIEQEMVSTRLQAEAAPAPGDTVDSPTLTAEAANATAQTATEWRNRSITMRAQLAEIQNEYRYLEQRMRVDDKIDASDRVRADTLREQIETMSTQIERLDELARTKRGAEAPPPDITQMNDVNAIATFAAEFQDMLIDVARYQVDQMIDAGGVPSLISLKSALDGISPDTQIGNWTVDDLISEGLLSIEGTGVRDFASGVREHMPQYQVVTDQVIFSEYLRSATTWLDLTRNTPGNVNMVVSYVAGMLEMDPRLVRGALNNEWETQLRTVALDAWDNARQATLPDDFGESGQIPYFELADDTATLPPEVAEQLRDGALRVFDRAMGEQRLFGAGESMGDVIRNLSPDELRRWFATGEVPQVIVSRLGDAKMLGDSQIGNINRAVEYLREVRQEIVTAQRDDILTGWKDIASYADERALDIVDEFNRRLEINNYDPARPQVDQPQVEVEDLPTLRSIKDEGRRRAREAGEQIRSEVETELEHVGGKPQISTAELGPNVVPRKVWLRLVREGWLGNADPRSRTVQRTLFDDQGNPSKVTQVEKPEPHGVPADEFAQRYKSGQFAGDEQAAFMDYVGRIQEMWRRETPWRNEEVVEQLADEMGLPVEVVETALRSTKGDMVIEYGQVGARNLDELAELLEDAPIALVERLAEPDGGTVLAEHVADVHPELADQLNTQFNDWPELAQYMADRKRLDAGRVPEAPRLAAIADGDPNRAQITLRAALDKQFRERTVEVEADVEGVEQRASLADAAAQAAAERAQAAAGNVEPDYWQRGEDGTLAPGEDVLRELGGREQQWRELAAEQQWKQAKLERLQRRRRHLKETLQRSKQDEIKSLEQRVLDEATRVTYQLSDRPLGEIRLRFAPPDPERPGQRLRFNPDTNEMEVPYVEITGTIRDVADKLGVTGALRRLAADEMSQFDPNPHGFGLNDRFDPETGSRRLKPAGTLDMVDGNRWLDMLHRAIEADPKARAAFDADQVLRGELLRATIADDIQRTIQSTGSRSLLRIEYAEQLIMARVRRAQMHYEASIEPRTGRLKVDEILPQIGNDFIEQIQQVFERGRTKRAHKFKVINDESTAVMTAPFRRVAILNRRLLGIELQRASELMQEAERKLAAQADLMPTSEQALAISQEVNALRAEANYIVSGAEEVATSTRMMLEQGYNPTHLTGGPGLGLTESATAPTSTKRTIREEMLPSQRRMMAGHIDPDLDAFSRREVTEMTMFVEQEVIRQIAQDPATSKSMYEVLAPWIEEWRIENDLPNDWPAWRQMTDKLHELGYRVVLDTTRSQPLSNMDLRQPGWQVFDQAPDVGRNILDDGGPRVIPEHLARALLDEFDTRTTRPGRGYDYLVGLWKVAVLPLRLTWWIGNIIGNAMMATIAPGTQWVSPFQLAESIGQVFQDNKRVLEQLSNQQLTNAEAVRAIWALGGDLPAMPSRLGAHNLTYQEYAGLTGAVEPDMKLGRALKLISDPEYVKARIDAADAGTGKYKLGAMNRAILPRFSQMVEAGYRMNELMDNMYRHALFNVELQRRLPEGVIRQDVMDRAGQNDYNLQPDVRLAVEESTRKALNALGDFSAMTPFERRWVRRVVPFYAWLRHQIKITFMLPLQSPLRAAFLNLVFQAMTPEDEQGDEWQKWFGASFETPLGRVRLQSAQPFGTLRDMPFISTEGTRVITPAIGVVADQVTDWDWTQQSPASRPSDQGVLGMYGGRESLSPLERAALHDTGGGIGEILFKLADVTPQSALVRDVALSSLPGTGFRGEGSRSLTSSVLDSGDVSPYPDREGGSLARVAGTFMPFPADQPEWERRVKLLDAMRKKQGG